MSSKALRTPDARSESESVCAPFAPVSAAEFRAACSRFATGITIVTCLDGEGLPLGKANTFMGQHVLVPKEGAAIHIKDRKSVV